MWNTSYISCYSPRLVLAFLSFSQNPWSVPTLHSAVVKLVSTLLFWGTNNKPGLTSVHYFYCNFQSGVLHHWALGLVFFCLLIWTSFQSESTGKLSRPQSKVKLLSYYFAWFFLPLYWLLMQVYIVFQQHMPPMTINSYISYSWILVAGKVLNIFLRQTQTRWHCCCVIVLQFVGSGLELRLGF